VKYRKSAKKTNKSKIKHPTARNIASVIFRDKQLSIF
jgi:hypothetical protein